MAVWVGSLHEDKEPARQISVFSASVGSKHLEGVE